VQKERQPIQLELAFATGKAGEAREPEEGRAEDCAAMRGIKSPVVCGPTMEEVLERENLRKALGQVRRNKGAPGFHAINWESDARITLRTTQPAERNSPDRWLADLVSHLRRDDLAHARVHALSL
jgi:hypothetical protein